MKQLQQCQVLYGVFLYMGINSLDGIQMWEENRKLHCWLTSLSHQVRPNVAVCDAEEIPTRLPLSSCNPHIKGNMFLCWLAYDKRIDVDAIKNWTLQVVSIFQVHLFTGLQLLCFVTLWLIQTFKQTSILFPIMLVLLIGIRKLLDFVFTPKELKVWS